MLWMGQRSLPYLLTLATYQMVRPWRVRPYIHNRLVLRRWRGDMACRTAQQRFDTGNGMSQIQNGPQIKNGPQMKNVSQRKGQSAPPSGDEISSWARLERRAARIATHRPSTPPRRHDRSFYRARGRGDLPKSG